MLSDLGRTKNLFSHHSKKSIWKETLSYGMDCSTLVLWFPKNNLIAATWQSKHKIRKLGSIQKRNTFSIIYYSFTEMKYEIRLFNLTYFGPDWAIGFILLMTFFLNLVKSHWKSLEFSFPLKSIE